MSIGKRITGIALCALAGAVFWAASGTLDRTAHEREWAIGYHDFPPFLFKGPDGKPHGFARETIDEAARRAGHRIRWVEVRQGARKAFDDGEIDLWPRSAVVPGLPRAPNVTDPWFFDSYGLVVRSGSTRYESPGARGPRISTGPTPFQKASGEKLLPGAVLTASGTVRAAIEEVLRRASSWTSGRHSMSCWRIIRAAIIAP